jgi:outer membrane protein OmpA-like peptidoglycan-associated protein
MKSYLSFGTTMTRAILLRHWAISFAAVALCGCAAMKGAGEGNATSAGAEAHHVVDGSGKAVNDAYQECVNTGHSAGAGGCAAGATGATVNAPPPAINAPPPQAATSAAPPQAATEPAPAAAKPAEPVAQATPQAPAEITKGEVVSAAPKLEELSLQAEALFGFGKSDAGNLLAAGKKQLDELAARIAQLGPNAVSKITVTGHADRLGLDAANQTLSRRRAETVQQYLASKGVPAALLQVSAKGESAPLVQCKGEKPTAKLKACLAANRRVEVVVYGQK